MKRFFLDIKKYKGYMLHSAKSQLHAELANSWLGGIWWVLEPTLFMLVYMFVYTVVFQRSTQYVVAFITLGLTYWRFFNNCVLSSITLVRHYRSVISKVYLPKFVFVGSLMMVNGYKMLFSYIPVIVLMIYYRIPLSIYMLSIIPVTLTLFLLTFGICCICMHIGVYVEVLNRLMRVLLQLLFYISGVFYPINEMLEPELAKLLFRLNPIALILYEARNALLYGMACQRKLILAYMVVGVVISMIGVKIIYKSESKYMKVV